MEEAERGMEKYSIQLNITWTDLIQNLITELAEQNREVIGGAGDSGGGLKTGST